MVMIPCNCKENALVACKKRRKDPVIVLVVREKGGPFFFFRWGKFADGRIQSKPKKKHSINVTSSRHTNSGYPALS